MISFFLPTTHASAQCVTRPAGLVSWWRAEATGNDTIGTNNGALINSVAFGPGKVGQCFNLSNGIAHIRIPDSPSLHFSNSLTIEGWIYPTEVGGAYHDVFTKWDIFPGLDQRSYGTGIVPDGTFAFSLCPDGTTTTVVIQSTNVVPTNQWTHFVDTYDGSSIKIYINGELQVEAPYNLGIFQGNGAVGIGASVGGGTPGQFISPFQGKIDEIAVYNRALDPSEVQAIYRAGSDGKCSPPTLSIASSGPDIFLSWPISAADYRLQEALGDLSVPASWLDIFPGSVTNNDRIIVTLPLNNDNRFYRLVRP